MDKICTITNHQELAETGWKTIKKDSPQIIVFSIYIPNNMFYNDDITGHIRARMSVCLLGLQGGATANYRRSAPSTH